MEYIAHASVMSMAARRAGDGRTTIIGASLSEPHIDELHVRNLYMYYVLYMVRPSPARRYIQCTATRDIFRRPHEETSALSGTTCIIIAESAKQIHSVCQNLSRERPS